MLERITRYLAPPVFPDDADKSRIAHLLNMILWTVFALAVAAGALLRLAGQTAHDTLIYLMALALLALVARFILRRGRVELASALLVAVFWVSFTGIIYMAGGVRVATFAVYTVVILMAGLLLGGRAAIAVAAASSLAGLALLYAELGQRLPPVVITPVTAWITHSVFFAFAAVLLYLATRHLDAALASARSSAQAVQAERDFARQIMETMGQGLYVINQAGVFEFVNPAYAAMLGRQPQDLIGKTPWDVTHEQDWPLLDQVRADRVAGKTTRYETRLVRTDGQVVHVLITGVPRYTNGRFAGAIAVVTDLTERRQMERALEQRAAELHALYETSLDINAQPDQPSLLRAIIHRAADLVGVDLGTLYLAQPDQSLEMAVGYNLPDRYLGTRLRPGEGLAGRVAQSGQPMTVSDYDQWEGRSLTFDDLPSHRILSVPLKIRERVIGVINLTDTQCSGSFSRDQIRLASLFADQAAIAIQNARLLEAEQRRSALLTSLNETVLQVNEQLDQPALLRVIVQGAARLVDAPTGALYLLQADGHTLEEVCAHNVQPEDRRLQVQMGQGILGRAAASGTPITLEEDAPPSPARADEDRLPHRSMMAVPLKWHGQVLGALGVLDPRPERFGPDQVSVVSMLAAQAAIAVQNARLFETEQRRVARLTALNAAMRVLSSQLELPALQHAILEQAARLVDAPMGTLYLMLPDEQTLEEAFTFNLPPEDNTLFHLRLGEGLSGRAAAAGEAIALDDYQQWPDRHPPLAGAPYRAMMAVPIKWQGRVLGTVGLMDTRPARFGPEEINLVSLLAAQAAVALQNVQFFQEIRRQVQELQVLHVVGQAATQAAREDDLIERVTQVIGQALPADSFGVMLLDPAQGVLRVHPSYRGISAALKDKVIALGQGITGSVAQTGRARCVADVWETPDYLMVQPFTRSELAVPLKVGEQVLGVINLASIRLNAFSQDDERLLTTLASQLAMALERLRNDAERDGLIRELGAKNAELERFTYTVSHDLKSPLITIRGFTGFLEQDAVAGKFDRLRADIARIASAADKMQRLLNDLLELSRIGRLMNPPEPTPFGVIAREAVELVRGSIDACGVQVVIAPDLPTVQGDQVRLVEVVQNLVDNAAKFMGDQPAPRIEIGQRGTDDQGRPILFVRDNGVGIEPQYHARVFGLFDKLDAQSEGTGVGLALVKRIVEVHGGKIWVESEGLGKGSAFLFTLST